MKYTNCSKSGAKHHDGEESDVGYHLFMCGKVVCPICTEYRKNIFKEEFSWAFNGDYRMLILKEFPYVQTVDDLNKSFELFEEVNKGLHKRNDLLFYRLFLSKAYITILIRSEDLHKFNYKKPIRLIDFIPLYVDYSRITFDTKEYISTHRKRRVRMKGKTPYVEKEPKLLSVLSKRHKTKKKVFKALMAMPTEECVPIETLEKQHIQRAKYRTPDKLLYSTRLPYDETKYTTLDFPSYLEYKLKAMDLLYSDMNDIEKEIINEDFGLYFLDFGMKQKCDPIYDKKLNSYLKKLYGSDSRYYFLEVLFK